jgi:hypothetical protein
MNKLFVIGLPRTGTTSISVALLNYGFKVAHTAYTKRTFELADVISDAPCFCDYKELDQLFPHSKFVYLERALERWVPSMQMLLEKMLPQLAPKTGYLNPVLKRAINQTFAPLMATGSLRQEHLQQQHLTACYLNHQQQVQDYFAQRNDFLNIDISTADSLQKLLAFLDIDAPATDAFPHLNSGKQVDSWKEYKHPNKINSLSAGKDHRQFFDYQLLRQPECIS